MGHLNTYTEIFDRAKSLSLEGDSPPKQARNEIVTDVENNYVNLYNSVSPIIGFASNTGTDFRSLEQEVKHCLDSAKNSSDKKKKELEEIKVSAQKILDDIKLVASEAGVEKTSFSFSEAEKNHGESAEKYYCLWKRSLVSLMIFVLAFIILCIYLSGWNLSSFKVGYIEVGGFAVTVLCFYAILFFKRNYDAEKHNETINANKARALKTFRAFVDGTDSESIKDSMLLLAGHAAFHTPTSGYAKNNQDVPLPVLQTIKDAYETTGRTP